MSIFCVFCDSVCQNCVSLKNKQTSLPSSIFSGGENMLLKLSKTQGEKVMRLKEGCTLHVNHLVLKNPTVNTVSTHTCLCLCCLCTGRQALLYSGSTMFGSFIISPLLVCLPLGLTTDYIAATDFYPSLLSASSMYQRIIHSSLIQFTLLNQLWQPDQSPCLYL